MNNSPKRPKRQGQCRPGLRSGSAPACPGIWRPQSVLPLLSATSSRQTPTSQMLWGFPQGTGAVKGLTGALKGCNFTAHTQRCFVNLSQESRQDQHSLEAGKGLGCTGPACQGLCATSSGAQLTSQGTNLGDTGHT